MVSKAQRKAELKLRSEYTGCHDIVLPEDGYKALIASILRMAMKDAAGNAAYCRDARWFIRSSWCMELCEGLDIDYMRYCRSVQKEQNKEITHSGPRKLFFVEELLNHG